MAETKYSYKHIVIVHGIGNQAPNETALGFMNEFIRALPRDGEKLEPIVHNLVESVDYLTTPLKKDSQPYKERSRSFQPAYIAFADRRNPDEFKVHVIGFSEVYWQPITDFYLEQNEKKLPIPLFTWARTIPTRLLRPGYAATQWRAVIENLETMLKLLEKIATISKNTELFVKVSTKFLGDVQMYAESDQIRQEINAQFFRVIGRVDRFANNVKKNLLTLQSRDDPLARGFSQFKDFEEPEIYVIAHSEGTVVSYNSLVQAAMLGEAPTDHQNDPEFVRAKEADDAVAKEGETSGQHAYQWLPNIRGLVTFGSPLDKHYLIWNTRFRKDFLKKEPRSKIPWFNWADCSDPVAYNLDELKSKQRSTQNDEIPARTDAEKLFEIKEDKAFKRYPLPGKAHVDYWTDRAIYEHIIYRVMKLAEIPGKPTPLDDGWWAPLLPLGDRVTYVVGRVLTFWLGLFFLSGLLSFDALEPVRSLVWLANAYHFLATQPFGPGEVLFNYATWLLAPLLVMKLFLEAERGWFGFYWPPMIRWMLVAAWLAITGIVAIFMKKEMTGSNLKGLTEYGTGLLIVVLAWKLQTTVQRGLIQLWRYTRVL